MIKEFCDICEKELTGNQVKVSVRCDIGSCNSGCLSFSSIHSDMLTLCEDCINNGIPHDTVGLDEDILQIIKDSIQKRVDRKIEID